MIVSPQCVQVSDAGHGDSAEDEAAKMSQSCDKVFHDDELIRIMCNHICADT